MRRGLVKEDNIETRGLVLAKLLEKDTAAGGIEAGQLPPAGVPRGGLHGGIQPVVLIEWLTDLERLAPIPGETTAHRQVKPEPAFVWAEAPHGWRRGLPASGRDGPKAARAWFDKVSRLGNGFLAWLGRGRFRWALS